MALPEGNGDGVSLALSSCEGSGKEEREKVVLDPIFKFAATSCLGSSVLD